MLRCPHAEPTLEVVIEVPDCDARHRPARLQSLLLIYAMIVSERKDRGLNHPSPSSSSIKPRITPRPLDQKAGSEASRPKGARSSLCRFEPPARSMSR